MTRDEAGLLLVESREARWTFPSSFGRPVPRGGETATWAERAAGERERFAEAARALLASGAADEAVELAANVWRLWQLAGDLAGGRRLLADVLDGGDGSATRSRALALYGDGLLAARAGAHEDARTRNEAALEVAERVGDPEALALAHLGSSRVAVDERDYERARDHAVRAREHAAAVSPALGQGPLHLHAQATRLLGDHDTAAALFAASLDLNRRIGDDGMVEVELHNLGHVEIHRGNVDAAARHFDERAERGTGDDPYSAALAGLNRAALAFARGRLETARSLVEAAQSEFADSGTVLAHDDQFELDWLRDRIERGGGPAGP